MRLDGTALAHDSLLPHPALSGGLERPTSRSLCTPPHPRFTLYSQLPRTSPSGSRPGTGCQRAGAHVPTTQQDGGGHDVSLMNFLSTFLHLQLIDISSDDFQQPIRSRPFPKIFPKIGRRCSPPIRSQEICEICHLRLIWSNLSHSTTSV